MRKTIELPDKMSELIRVALGDLKAAEKCENIVIDMERWHTPLGNGRCAVCLAGAVMRRGLDPSQDYVEVRMDDALEAKFDAINNLRVGDVSGAAYDLLWDDDLVDSMAGFNRPIEGYSPFPSAFYADMEKLAADLEAAGY